MTSAPRVAFFPDSFEEVDGVAMTSKRLINYARRNNFPMLCVHAGKDAGMNVDGSVKCLSLTRSALAIPMDHELKYDPLFNRHVNRVLREILDFQPNIIHITGLNDVSIIGAYIAWKLKMPLIASWHTNLHEFAARRIFRWLNFAGDAFANSVAGFSERKIFDGAALYYKMPRIILVPNQDLADDLAKKTGRPTRLMARGVDSELYDPAKRTINDGIKRIGFVGRLRSEKNVRVLAEIEKKLIAMGLDNFRFVIVGEGNERGWLEENMKFAEFTGFLHGEKLAEAYANMDIFVFPSETDAFGNVVQEANASGVPSVVANSGGPKFIVTNGYNGFIAESNEVYATHIAKLLKDGSLLDQMKKTSREFALSRSWDAIFAGVYKSYNDVIDIAANGPSLAK